MCEWSWNRRRNWNGANFPVTSQYSGEVRKTDKGLRNVQLEALFLPDENNCYAGTEEKRENHP